MFHYVKVLAGKINDILCVFSDSVWQDEQFNMLLDVAGICLKIHPRKCHIYPILGGNRCHVSSCKGTSR